ncbi:hypothetical protein GCM10010435_27150 [Winogradskya consettensis]|uniref:Uncharacterized protein n=1 Tax=Winogradskya consettensis TaxID=113560 RepID=A0A919SCU4_9ACTN|nr:hypothetical protein [Actinoplanes consettensis]GIM68235.1 hypothetical protein Aco04nite_09940 [Actinoplanes consettensis]
MPEQTLTVSWWWDWVPAAGGDTDERTAWTAALSALLDGWAGDGTSAVLAADLLARADQLAPHCRLVWGMGFLGDDIRWMPVIALVEFREAFPGDSAYLMGAVGAEGFADDVREPNVEYVSTRHGDGVRVIALARTEENGLHGRVDAALRLERATGDLDILVTTRVNGLSRLAVIGDGIDALLNVIADDSPALAAGVL